LRHRCGQHVREVHHPWDVLGVWQEDAEVHQFLRREEVAYPESHVEEDEEDDAIHYSRDDESLNPISLSSSSFNTNLTTQIFFFSLSLS